MKPEVLRRYARHDDGAFIIDINATRVEDLYNDFDRNAPYIRRDLDENLCDYLILSATELKQQPFIVRLNMNHFPEEDRQTRVRQSIKAYFAYLAEKEKHMINLLFRKFAIFIGIGLVMLFLSVSTHQELGEHASVILQVFAEGLTVAAWVSMWQAFALLLVEWSPYRLNIRLYNRLSEARIIFQQPGQLNP